nr:2-dehydropantoate 2-reductase [Gammaproteobacteria bacterium]
AGAHAQQILKSSGFAITFQNGIGNVETLQQMLGHDRVLGGISYHSARIQEPGHSVHTNANTTWIGELNGESSPRARQLASVLNNAGFSVELTDRIDAVIWTKFVLNCAVNPICALTGCRTGEIGLSPTGRQFQSFILDEIFQLLQAKKIEPTDSDLRATIDGFSGRLFNKPSMLQHMENGLETEIDSLNGAAVREAASLGLRFPYNEALTLLIKTRNYHVIKMLEEPAIDYEALEAAALSPR